MCNKKPPTSGGFLCFKNKRQLTRDSITTEDIEYKTCNCPSKEDNDDTDNGIDNNFLSSLFSFIFFTRSEDFPATPECHSNHDETEEREETLDKSLNSFNWITSIWSFETIIDTIETCLNLSKSDLRREKHTDSSVHEMFNLIHKE